MTRQEKQNLIEKLNELYNNNQFVFLVQTNAVNASDALSFRSNVRKHNSSCVLAKNTLSKIAARNAGLEDFTPHFSNQVLTVFTNNPVEIAKLFNDYEKQGYSIIAGTDKASIFNPDDVKKLAKVPPLPELRSMLLSTLLGVHTRTVRVISEIPASLARIIANNSKN
jgi:large subunit ribosomal protein L10